MAWERSRGSSVQILNVQNLNISDYLQIPSQHVLDSFYNENTVNPDSDIGGTPGIGKSIIKKLHDDGNLEIYHVTQTTDAIIETIEIYTNRLLEWGHGYQRKAQFYIVYDKEKKYLYIFTNKPNTEILINRLKRSGRHYTQKIIFDFHLLDRIEEKEDIWGAWIRNMARGRTEAYFTQNLDRSDDIDLSQATTIHIKIITKDDKVYDISLSKNGRISSNTQMPYTRLLKLFHDCFECIVKPIEE